MRPWLALFGIILLAGAFAMRTLSPPTARSVRSSVGTRGAVSASFKPGTPPERIRQRLERDQSMLRYEVVADRWGSNASKKGVQLTYSFPPDGTPIDGFGFVNEGAVTDPNERINHMHARWNLLFGNEEIWKGHFRQAFARMEAISGIRYIELESDDGASWPDSPGPLNGGTGRGDIRIVSALDDGPGVGVVAFNFYPETGDMFLDSADANLAWFGHSDNNYRKLRNTIIHENGHGVGLQHSCPQNGTKVMEPLINDGFDGLQLDDILGVQFHYGDRFETGAGNDIVSSAVTMAEAGFAIDGASHSVVSLSINSPSDVDVFRLDITGPSSVDATLTVIPRQGVYFTGEEGLDGACPAGASFNPADRADLAMTIRDLSAPFGDTINAAPAGVAESHQTTLLIDRSYAISIFANPGAPFLDVQGYNLTVRLERQPLLCDISGDGCVDGTDLAILLSHWGSQSGSPADINGDGIVLGEDLAFLLAGWLDCSR